MENLIEKFEKELAVLIAVQHLGQPTIDEIKQYTERLQDLQGNLFNLQHRSIKKHCTNLNKKGLISTGFRSTEQGQEAVFSMTKGYVKFPEVAQIKDIVKEESLKVYLEKLEGTAGIKKEKNVFGNYLCRVKWKIADGVAGFYPNADGVNIHYREQDGKIVFFPNHFRQYIRKNLSKFDKSVYIVDNIGFTYGHAILNGSKPHIDSHFVLVRGDIRGSSGGAGEKKVEILPKGTEVETKFVVPAKEFTPDQFRKFLEIIGQFGNCGFGAYSTRYGKMDVVEFTIEKESL